MHNEAVTSKREPVDYQPRRAILVDRQAFTDQDTLFAFELEDGRPLDHLPGQFVQVFVPGVGEAPFSVSSAPTNGGPFELCIRAVGSVTNAIHALAVGDTVGIRGPYGQTCDFERFWDNDLLFIAGGIGLAPLRSMINFVLANRERFGSVTVLYGCKAPSEILFEEEIAAWTESADIDFQITVDEVPDGQEWDGHTGVITTLMPALEVDPESTYAIVCGPPVMFQFVQQQLDEKEIPHDHVYLSVERRMHCGVGLCGHCQINDLYVCQDGPVFNYEELKKRPEALA